MTAAVDQGLYDAHPPAPRPMTSFYQWCEEVLKPAVLA
jgi:hypothetical protein